VVWRIPYIEKFWRYKRFTKKFHGVKFSCYEPSTIILTRGENVEEYGRDRCICGCHVYHEIWEAATGAVTT